MNHPPTPTGPEEKFSNSSIGRPWPRGLHVRLELFEGPVELLLYLVRQNALDVTDIPIGQLTDDYLSYVRQAQQLDLEVAADFLVMAGVLLRIKTRQLVPGQPPEDTETPTVTLEQILDEFRRYQQVAQTLGSREAERSLVFPRPGEAPQSAVAESEDLYLLAAALRRVLARMAPVPRVAIEPRKIRIEDMLATLRQLLASRGPITFEDAVARQTLTEVIAMFLAVLELVRLGEVRIRQESGFGVIMLEPVLSAA